MSEVRKIQTMIPERPIRERLQSFEEVSLGFSEEQALAEASRCLQCSKPGCMTRCPIGVDVPAFISLIRSGDYSSALEKIREVNPLPSICGRFCPQEDLCSRGCWETIRYTPISVGALERFVADRSLFTEDSRQDISGAAAEVAAKSVAVIGSGPGGLTAAAELRKRGYQVVMFEALHELGGVLRYGIPEFRLPKKIVRAEIEHIRRLGVEMRTNMMMGTSETIDELFEEGFDSVIIATGAGLPKFYNVPGENLCGIYSSNEFLIRTNLMGANDFPTRSDTPVKAKGIVTVVGSRGIDSARCAIRLGAKEVNVLYGWKLVMRSDDIRRAREEGIKFQPFTQPLEFIGDDKGWVKQVKCIKTELILDKNFRKKLVPIKGTEFIQDADVVVIARGQDPNAQIAKMSSGIQVTAKSKTITVNPETYETTRKGVFAIGDVASGAGRAIDAIAEGKKVADVVSKFLA